MYDKLVAKVNNIDARAFVLKTKYDTEKSEFKKKFMILLDLLQKHTIMHELLK